MADQEARPGPVGRGRRRPPSGRPPRRSWQKPSRPAGSLRRRHAPALKFTDPPRRAELTGHAVRYGHKQPRGARPAAAPGRAGRRAGHLQHHQQAGGHQRHPGLGLLNEAVGLGLPVVAVPFRSVALAPHPPSGAASAGCVATALACCSTRTPIGCRRRTSARPAGTCSPGERCARSLTSSPRSPNRQIRSLALSVGLVGSGRILPAHVGCLVDPDGSRRVPSDRLDDQRDDQALRRRPR
jgi:hypothetical protein